MKKMITTLMATMLATLVFSQIKNNLWRDVQESSFASEAGKRNIVPSKYRTLSLDLAVLDEILKQAPMRNAAQEPASLSIPMPDGAFQHFKVVEAPIMHPDLAAKFPDIRTYAGWSKEDPTAYARFGVTQKGFHAVIFSARHSTVFIDAFAEGDTAHYTCYFKKDFQKEGSFSCLVEETPGTKSLVPGSPVPKTVGDCNLRTYDLALACTGEYAQYHGGTVPSVMAEYAIAMTRVNGIYEREAAVTMQLVPNTDLLIFLEPNTDPYTNGSGGMMLNQNQATCNNIIGNANYDIGHVFSTGGGGVAFLNSVCSVNNKAKGVTGLSNPTGDPFWVDYVAHEMGHQFGGNHTQNNSCNRNNATAMEPGSASTIMGYAGICAPNVQSNSDDYFHAINLDEIAAHVTGFGNSCATTTNTGNTAPSVSVAAGVYSVPVSTPLVLTAIATDPDGDVLTYCWEQMNNQSAPMPPQATNTIGPAFRSLSPQESPSRYLPNLPAVISGDAPTWEVLPSVSRTMFFRCTVRDNHPGAGCTAEADVVLNFTASAGPFRVSEPNVPSVVWTANLPATVTWDVAKTDEAPVNSNLVDLLLSVDGGFTYPYTLLAQTPNDGSQTVMVPAVFTEKARVMVRSVNNVFYDISDQDFTIEMTTFTLTAAPPSQAACQEGTADYLLTLEPMAGFDETVTFSAIDLPPGASVTFNPPNAVPPAVVVMTVGDMQNAPPGDYLLTVTASSPSIEQMVEVGLTLLDTLIGQPVLILPADGAINQEADPTTVSWEQANGADSYLLEVALNPSFQDIFHAATVPGTSYQIPGTAQGIVYYWRVKGTNICNEGPYSEVFAFQTAVTDCIQYVSQNTPIEIAEDQPSMITDAIVVENEHPIVSVKVHLNISHTYPGDLIAILDVPQIGLIQLFDRPGVPATQFGCSGDDLFLTFFDNAPLTAEDLENTCEPLPPAIGGDFQPIQPLSLLQGLSGSEEWFLHLEDVFEEDGGSLKEWYVEICTAVPNDELFVIINEILVVFQGQSGEVTSDLLMVNGDPGQVFYTLKSIPAHGTLFLSGQPLGIGGMFSQAQINNGELVYVHDGTPTQMDGFLFDVNGIGNGWLHNELFRILILENTLAATAEITQQLDCHNDGNAIITITATGGTVPLVYSLNGGPFQTNNVFENLGPGTYTAEVMDSTGSTITADEVTVDNPAALAVSAVVSGNSITVDASGGTGTLQYSLDGGSFQSSNVFENLPAGTYSITVQDENGCTETVTAEILPSALVASAVVTQPLLCFGENAGEITVTASGGTPPYEYALNGGPFQSSNVFQGLGPGTYTIEVMDADGTVQATGQVELTEPAQLTASATVIGNTVTVDANGGTGTLQYSLDGGPFQSSNVFENLPIGTYTITVQDENGCTVTLMASVSASMLSVSAAITQGIGCFGENDGEITVTATGGSAPYEYSLDGGPFQSSNIFQNLGPGTYIAEVMDADGTVLQTGALTLVEPTELTASANVNGADIAVDASGGTGILQYSLNGGPFQGNNVFENLPNGNYTITVQDENGCTSTVSATVSVSSLVITAAVTQAISCFGENDGEITVTIVSGTPPFEYSLNGGPSQGSNVFQGLAVGAYIVTVMDGDGFTQTTLPIQVDAPAPISGTVQVNGYTVEVVANGGTGNLTYSLDGGPFQAGNLFFPVPGGDHEMAVRDENGCEEIIPFEVDVPALNASAFISQTLLCWDSADGEITVIAEGGVQPYEYSLNGGPFQAGNVFGNLAPGNYVATVRDTGGFTFTAAVVTLTAPPALVVMANVAGTTITVDASGGTLPYQYQLDGGDLQPANFFLNVPDGTHTVNVVDGNDCEMSVSVTVTSVPAPVITVSIEQGLSCFGDSTAVISVNVNGGVAPFQFSLNGVNYQDDNVFAGLPAGQHLVSVQDADGTVFMAPAVTVSSPPAIMASANAFGLTITVSASGGTGDLQYSLDGGPFQNSNEFGVTSNGAYTVAVMDENGCTIEVTALVSVPVAMQFVVNGPSCQGLTDGLIVIQSVTGGIPPYLYSINGGPFTPALNYPGLSPGEYIFTVQDATGYQFEAPPVMVVDPLPVEALMEVDGNTLTVNASGGTAPYLFSINGGQSFQAGNVFPDLPNNVYEVVVVDDNGCAYGTTVTINYTSVNDLHGRLMFEVMPNPSDGLFTLRMDLSVPAKLNLAVFDVAGRLVFRSSLEAGTRVEERLDLRFLANGSYELRVDDSRAWGVKRLIIIR